jgi:hypothetical protein
VPIALKDMLREAADATVADAHRSWGEVVAMFSVQEALLQFLFREEVR